MLNNPRKNLSFSYNSLNLLDGVKTGSTVKARYLYSYDGTKVKVQDTGGTNGYDYLGSLTLVKTSGTQVMYFEKDHLGSIRTVQNTSGTVIERNDYYPFGMRHANASHVVTANNRYKFNGKEDQTVGDSGCWTTVQGCMMPRSAGGLQLIRWRTVTTRSVCMRIAKTIQ